MDTIFYSIFSTIIVSVISLVGIFVFLFKKTVTGKSLLWLVSFSAGTLLGGAFLHLIPEALSKGSEELFFLFILLGFFLFYILEKGFLWHHCHKHGISKESCGAKKLGYMNLLGDGFHNFLDGIIIATSFSVGFEVGVATTIAVVAHEVPQEISDFGVLIYSGFSSTKALLFNFLSSLLAIIGAIFGLALINSIEKVTFFLITIAAAGFIYIAVFDLVPELKKEYKTGKSLWPFLTFVLGVLLMFVLKITLE